MILEGWRDDDHQMVGYELSDQAQRSQFLKFESTRSKFVSLEAC